MPAAIENGVITPSTEIAGGAVYTVTCTEGFVAANSLTQMLCTDGKLSAAPECVDKGGQFFFFYFCLSFIYIPVREKNFVCTSSSPINTRKMIQ